ncbi:hypothetical protein ACFQVC_37305 [Streptomyces monticola]|uniref:Uncharacterized protein n=1 Tax=Streptomyces monticola TaxID=2666263 RepID=A0ABW2JW66_9ACTN
MHPEIHLLLHTQRAGEFRHEAAQRVTGGGSLRVQLGWRMVELGLRLATPRTAVAAAVSS